MIDTQICEEMMHKDDPNLILKTQVFKNLKEHQPEKFKGNTPRGITRK